MLAIKVIKSFLTWSVKIYMLDFSSSNRIQIKTLELSSDRAQILLNYVHKIHPATKLPQKYDTIIQSMDFPDLVCLTSRLFVFVSSHCHN